VQIDKDRLPPSVLKAGRKGRSLLRQGSERLRPVRTLARAPGQRGRLLRQAFSRQAVAGFDDLPRPMAVRIAFNTVLQREPDDVGLAHYVRELRTMPRPRMLEIMRWSEESWFNVRVTDLLNSLHVSRCEFVRGLPRARRILDLGGTHQSNRDGAFVHLGYPYPFERLILVDLPIEERHQIYQLSEEAEVVQTHLGPVEYAYHSMADLSRYDDGSFDLVYSGQTIEHVSPADCDLTLAETFRVLAPGGWFAVDTPNDTVCRLQTPEFINDDHQVEYTHAEFSAKLERAGFEIVEAKGLNYLGHPASAGGFDEAEVAGNWGLYGEPEDCYLLAYLARKPLG
jgi:SAM-dependent methyltransferase